MLKLAASAFSVKGPKGVYKEWQVKRNGTAGAQDTAESLQAASAWGSWEGSPDVQLVHPGLILAGHCRLGFPALGLLLLLLLLVLHR